jgi:hypothetical protein
MKGPYERFKYDLRRLWECPACHKRERAPGSLTSRLCLCQMKQPDGQPVVMKLIEDGPQRIVPPVAIAHEPLPPLPPVELEPAASESTPELPAQTVLLPQTIEPPATEPPAAAEPPADAS